MLHLISSIQIPTYALMEHCRTLLASNDIQYAQIVPPEAEKHTSPYIFYGILLTTKNSTALTPWCELVATHVYILTEAKVNYMYTEYHLHNVALPNYPTKINIPNPRILPVNSST